MRQVKTELYKPKTVFIVPDQTKLGFASSVKRKKSKKPKQQVQNQSRSDREHPTKPNLVNQKSASKKEDTCKHVHSTILKNGKEIKSLPLKYTLNAQCVRNKLTQLEVLISEEGPDIIAITETWLSSDITLQWQVGDRYGVSYG